MLTLRNVFDARKAKRKAFSVKPQVALKREYQRSIDNIVKYIYATFKSVVVEGMDRQKVTKQLSLTKDESYNQRLNRLIKEFEKRVRGKYSKDFIRRLCEKHVRRVYAWQNREFKKRVESFGLGLAGEDLLKEYRSFMKLKLDDNVALVQGLVESEMNQLKNQVMRNMANGAPASELARGIRNHLNVSRNRAETIARTEVNTLTGQLNDRRALEIGLTKGIWRGVEDNRERKSHREAEGKEFDLRKGLKIDGKYTWPGREPNCRCWTEYPMKQLLRS